MFGTFLYEVSKQKPTYEWYIVYIYTCSENSRQGFIYKKSNKFYNLFSIMLTL